MMLEGKNVTKYFGGLAAVKNVDFIIKEKEIVGLIGPNGAGKTTLFNLINGLFRPDSGTIHFYNDVISGLKPHDIARKGIARVFQLVRPFLTMSALDNVVAAVFAKRKNISLSEALEEAKHYLEFVGFRLDKKDIMVRNLSLFDRKQVELARALATKPKLLLLDEYVAGLNPTEVHRANKLIMSIRDDLGITIFWIEHIMRAVMANSDRIIVLHHGEKIADGKPEEIANDPRVITAYLGEKYA